MGFPPGSSGPLLHRGEKRQLFPLVEHGDSNLVFDLTCLSITPKEGNCQPTRRRGKGVENLFWAHEKKLAEGQAGGQVYYEPRYNYREA